MAIESMFNDIVTAVEAIVDANGKRVVNTVDIWNNQFDNEAIETSFNYPAVLIEFSELEWSPLAAAGGYNTDATEEQRSKECVMVLHIGHSHLEHAGTSFSAMHAVNQAVYFAVQNMNTSLYGPLLRIRERQDTNHGRVIDWQMDFRFTLAQTGQSVNKTEIESGVVQIIIS